MSQVANKSDSTTGWSEIQDLLQQTQQENTSMRQQLETLRQENRHLKDRLKSHDLESLQHSKTDNEKAMLLHLEGSVSGDDRSHHTNEDLDETSGSYVILTDSNGEQILPGFPLSSSDGSIIPEERSNVSDSNWDIMSSEGEGSVACLQDRIHQMEENHYTVNEELQATIQELTDLQDNVNELTYENEKLAKEKSIVIEALYRQLEKVEQLKNILDTLRSRLEDSHFDIDFEDLDDTFNTAFTDISLQSLDLTDAGAAAQGPRDRKRLSEIMSEHRKETQSEVGRITEKMRSMEQSLETAIREMEQQSQELTVAKGKLASTEMELERTQAMVEEERLRVTDMLHNQDPEGKLNLVMLMDNAKQEKEALDHRCAILDRALRESQQHAAKQQLEIDASEQDFEAAQEHVEREVKQMKDLFQEIESEKHELETEVINLKETVLELEEARERHEADKQKHLTTISDLNQAVQTLRKEKQDLHRELVDLKRVSARDTEEWMQFQKDLQFAVVIANDYRSEALTEVQQLEKEKEELLGKIKSLNAELERLRKLERLNPTPNLSPSHQPKPTSTETEIRQRMHAYMKSESDIGGRGARKGNSINTQLSVKSLIKSIETAAADDTPKIPQSPTTLSPSPSFSNSKPFLERRNTTMASTNPFDSKPVFSRRNTTTSMTSAETKTVLSHAARTCDDSKLPKADSLSLLFSPDVQLRSPPTRSPSTPVEARQTIGDALFRRKDFPSRKSNSPTMQTARESNIVMTDSASSDMSRTPVNPKRTSETEKKDPLAVLVKSSGGGGSKRNALLKWCQAKTAGFKSIDITNFSSSWNDGLGFCAIMYSYMPGRIPMHELNSQDKRRNFTIAFKAAEELGIPSILDIDDMVKIERPDWQCVMTYVTSLYKYFET